MRASRHVASAFSATTIADHPTAYATKPDVPTAGSATGTSAAAGYTQSWSSTGQKLAENPCRAHQW